MNESRGEYLGLSIGLCGVKIGDDGSLDSKYVSLLDEVNLSTYQNEFIHKYLTRIKLFEDGEEVILDHIDPTKMDDLEFGIFQEISNEISNYSNSKTRDEKDEFFSKVENLLKLIQLVSNYYKIISTKKKYDIVTLLRH